jgi:hypothetical protein
MTPDRLEKVRVFISHSSADLDLVKALVACLEQSLVVPDGAIVCTSLPGYDLSAGARVSDALLKSIERCSVLLAVLTQNSLKSGYCLMELGAAWGLRKMACAVLGPAVTNQQLPALVAETHCVPIANSPSMAGLCGTVAERTGFQLRNDSKRSQATAELAASVAALVAKTNPPVARAN